MSKDRIPAHAGKFSVFTGKRHIRGHDRRVRVLVFTTHDGFVGESRAFKHREAYEAAVAERARTQFQVVKEEENRLPRPWERCNKPAPAAILPHNLDDSTLWREVERRGYVVVAPEFAGTLQQAEPTAACAAVA